MAVLMHQEQVRELVIAPIPILVVLFHFIARLEVQAASPAASLLALVELDRSAAPQAVCTVADRPVEPIPVVRTPICRYFTMADDLGRTVVDQGASARHERVTVPVATLERLLACALMLAELPLAQLDRQEMIHPGEDLLRLDMAMVMAPTPDEGIELLNYLAPAQRIALLEHGFQLDQMITLRLVARRDDRRKTEGVAVGILPGLVLADTMVSKGKSQEVEPRLLPAKRMGDAGFLLAQRQSCLSQPRFDHCLDLLQRIAVLVENHEVIGIPHARRSDAIRVEAALDFGLQSMKSYVGQQG